MTFGKDYFPQLAAIPPQSVAAAGSKSTPYVQLGPDYQGLIAAILAGALGGGSVATTFQQAKKVAVAATGTLTGTTVVAGNTCTVNGVVFTAVASGATGNQFNVGGTDTITMANLAAAINASTSAGIPDTVRATSATNVVTITAIVPGTGGNALTLAVGQASIVRSAATLAGGLDYSAAKALAITVAALAVDNASAEVEIPISALDQANGFDSVSVVLTVTGGTGSLVAAAVFGTDQKYMP